MLKLTNLYSRSAYFCLWLFSLLLALVSFALQFIYQLPPCFLCLIDRALVIGTTLLFLIAFFHHPAKVGHLSYCLTGALLASLGILTSLYHRWLLSLPLDQLPDCNASFGYIMKTLPLIEALTFLLKGSGGCAEKNNILLGVYLPTWTMVGFILIALGCLFACWAKPKGMK